MRWDGKRRRWIEDNPDDCPHTTYGYTVLPHADAVQCDDCGRRFDSVEELRAEREAWMLRLA